MPVRDGERVLVALSGGGDSVGLLALLVSARPRPDLEVGVLHVHHGLRGADADADAAMARAVAASLGLPFRLSRLRAAPPRGESVEAWAREARYGALERARRSGGWDWVLTAHTLDDQAETLLLRIARGAGLDGLAGILPQSGRVLRPVLGFTGVELRQAAEACGLPWAEDATNRDHRFLRNRMRHEILPVLEQSFPGFTGHLGALARHARLASESRPRAPIAVEAGNTVYFPLGALCSLPEGAAREALRDGLRALKGELSRITERHVAALLALCDARVGATVALPGPWEGVREMGGVRLRPAAPEGGDR